VSGGWWLFGFIVVIILGAVMPLLRNRGQSGRAPLPPRKETLRDWRNER